MKAPVCVGENEDCIIAKRGSKKNGAAHCIETARQLAASSAFSFPI
jgi:hypothetical protein